MGAISDALVFATMCIVGFPVEAHLKDGSIYSGIFFTVSVENSSGIVLKNARMTKKGKSAANVGRGSVIETLVVRFADLFQVVVKGISVPQNGVACNISGDPFKVVVGSEEGNMQKKEAPTVLGNESQVEDDKSLNELVHNAKKSEIHNKETKHEVEGSSLHANDSFLAESKSVGEVYSDSSSKHLPNGDVSDVLVPFSDKFNDHCKNGRSSETSACSNVVTSRDLTHIASTETVHPKHLILTPKESKLNPGAKLFCPSATNHRSLTAPAVPTVANLAYVPDNFSVGPITSCQSDVEINPFISRSSVPVKFLPYGNLVAGNGFDDSQYSQQYIGHTGTRTQAVRYGGQHLHSVHSSGTCVTSNPQNIMVGQGGQQLVYMRPVLHDVNQTAAAFSQVSLRPSLTPHTSHLLKHQGNVAGQPLQVYVNPPFMSGGQQQIAVQTFSSYNPPPFPVIHPISSTGGATTGFFTPKFP